MAVSAMLRATTIAVAPGASGRCHVLIRNRSAVVDQFVFSVLGAVTEWTEVKPARVNLLPNQEVAVELTFSPPRSHEVLGTHASGCTGRFVHEVRGRQRERRRAPQPRRAT